jgi:hypothetical protein
VVGTAFKNLKPHIGMEFQSLGLTDLLDDFDDDEPAASSAQPEPIAKPAAPANKLGALLQKAPLLQTTSGFFPARTGSPAPPITSTSTAQAGALSAFSFKGPTLPLMNHPKHDPADVKTKQTDISGFFSKGGREAQQQTTHSPQKPQSRPASAQLQRPITPDHSGPPRLAFTSPEKYTLLDIAQDRLIFVVMLH